MKRRLWLTASLISVLAPVYIPAILFVFCRTMEKKADEWAGLGVKLSSLQLFAMGLAHFLSYWWRLLIPFYVVFFLLCIVCAFVSARVASRCRESSAKINNYKSAPLSSGHRD